MPTKEIDKLINNLYDTDTLKSIKSLRSITGTSVLGSIALFAYPDPKFKDQLPVYDILPLIIILGFDSKHLHGINLHYIPPTYRIKFATKVMQQLDDGNILTYRKISKSWAASKVPDVFTQFAYRQYLKGRIASQVKIFDYTNYYEAVTNILPRFKKQTEAEVYSIIKSKLKKR